jgi:threonine dehydrogenase-like Zn-dependent dehydrogenase
MLAFHHSGLAYGKLITHVFPVEQAQEAFDTFVSGNEVTSRGV